MGDIKAFMRPPVAGETKEVYISKRFTDDEGKPVPFVIRAIDQDTNDSIVRKCTTKKTRNGVVVQEIDQERLSRMLVVACTVEPNFRDTALCDYYKTVDPLEVPGRMLSVGEFGRLSKAIMEINGTMDESDFAEAMEEAKNL